MDRADNTSLVHTSDAVVGNRKMELSLVDDQIELTIDDPEEDVVFLSYHFELLGNDYIKPVESKIDELSIFDDKKAIDNPNVLTMFDQIDMDNDRKTRQELDIKSFRPINVQRVEETAAWIGRPQGTSRYNKVFSSMKKGEYIETISIPGWHVSAEIVYYEVVLSNKQLCWNCWIRFNSFTILHLLLKDLVKNLTIEEDRVHLPPFPEKQSKMLKDHFSEEFIENRRALLENYLQKVNSDDTLRYAEDFISFLMPPQEQGEIASSPSPDFVSPVRSSMSPDEEKSSVPSALDELTANIESPSNSPVMVNRYRFVDREQKLMLFVSDKDEITGIHVKSTTTLRDGSGSLPHVIYHIHVRNVNKGPDFKVWIVMKRFYEFVNFDERLRSKLSVTNPSAVPQLPTLPPKFHKSWTDHLNPVFIEKRRVLLEVYLRRLIRYPLYRRHPLTLKFLGVQNDLDSYIAIEDV